MFQKIMAAGIISASGSSKVLKRHWKESIALENFFIIPHKKS